MELLSPKDVKAILRVSLPMIYKLAERGKLPCVRFGLPDDDSKRVKLCLRFKKTDVLEFIERHYSGS
ncbi:MAG: helix-turn-helix domain-containing protein [Desulfobacterales bacterium]|nr:MAG: helix-turn-helix domain-containing protein [Desulfobacterales bacterium]